MNFHQPIRGQGGNPSSSKKGSNSTDAANTLRGRARTRLLFLVSEGEVESLGDHKDIYFNQTPLQNADNSFNFPNVTVQVHKGLADEGFFTGQDAVETPVNVDTQVKVATGPVVRTIVDENADAVRVIGRLSALVSRDASTGALNPTSVSYAIDVQPSGGAWTQVVLASIANEKTTSPYPFAHRVPLPAGGAPWNIRFRRITADSASENLQNDTFWDSYVVLVEGKFVYPHSAMVSIELNAEDIGTSVPAIAFRTRGIKVSVPTNYDPVARTYTGIWNGTFKTAWTNNPAWIFYDLITQNRYGLGEFVSANIVDKWSLYAIAQYCDQLVPSGYKDENDDEILEPRYTFNGVINRRDEAYLVLQMISTAWRGMTYWSMGQVVPTADMPSDAVKIVSPANVIGQFQYSGTALKARHSVCLVSWNDPNNFYGPAVEAVIDDAALKKWGWREKALQLEGCTSRGLAHRYGKWVLDTEQHETETVEYTCSLDQIDVRPGQIIAIADPSKAGVRIGGRIKSHAGDVITLDRAFEPAVGETYSLMLVMPDGTLETKAIESFAGAAVTVADSFSDTAVLNAMFAITGTDVTPRTYKVVAIEEVEPHVFKVSALFHDPLKFARVEQNLIFDPLPYTRQDNISVPPSNLDVQESAYILNGTTRTSLLVSWTPPENVLPIGYRVSVETPSEGYISLGETPLASMAVQDVQPGDYTFHVSTVTLGGIVSPEATITYTALGPSGMPMPTVSGLILADRPASTQFVGKDVHLAWSNNFAAALEGAVGDDVSPHYKHNTVKIYEANSMTLLRTQRVLGETFDYSYDMNVADCVAAALSDAARSLVVRVSVTDIFDRTSNELQATFTNPQPAAITPVIVVMGQSASITWPATPDQDYAGTKIWISEVDGFDPALTSPVFDGVGNSFYFTGDPDVTYYVRIAGYDSFSATGLALSPQYSFTNGNFIGLINEDFAEVPGFLFGDGESSLYAKLQEIYAWMADIAEQSVSDQAVGHLRRLELKATLGEVQATFTEQISVIATDIEAITQSIVVLEAAVGDGVAGIIADLEALATEVEANATATTEVAAQLGEVTAGALWKMQAIVAPGGVTARFAMLVRASDADSFVESGFLIDILPDGLGGFTSRIAIKTDSLVVTDGINTEQALIFEDGVLKILAARIERLTAPDGVNFLDLGSSPELYMEG